jgi:dTDP-4-dehydrorhamnose 3,5-epimerase
MPDTSPSLLETTLAAARADQETVTSDDKPTTSRLPDGMTTREVPIHLDDRGSVVEMFDTRWNCHPDPIDFVYSFTLRPGIVKGWGLHQHHEDRYFLLQGEMELVLYDVRPDSSTYGQVSKIYLSPHNHRLVNIAAFVWHADHNVGSTDVMVVNFPTMQYDHKSPD